jgi:hypothetical protein
VAYESLPLDLVLRHVDLVHTVTLYVSENCFNIILLSGPRFLGVLFPLMFLSIIFMHFYSSYTCYLSCLITLTTFSGEYNCLPSISQYCATFFLISNILLSVCFPVTVCLLFVELQSRFNFHVT